MTDAPDMNRRGALKALLGFAAAAAGATVLLGTTSAEAAPVDTTPAAAPEADFAPESTLPEHDPSQYYVVRRRRVYRRRYYYRRPRRVYRRRYVRRVYFY